MLCGNRNPGRKRSRGRRVRSSPLESTDRQREALPGPPRDEAGARGIQQLPLVAPRPTQTHADVESASRFAPQKESIARGKVSRNRHMAILQALRAREEAFLAMQSTRYSQTGGQSKGG